MKANITLALSMLSLVLLIFVHEATPASLNDTRNSTDQSTPEKHDRGMHGNHSGMTIAPPNGTPTSTESQTSATSGNTTQQTEKTTSPPLTKQTISTSLPKTSPSTSTTPSHNKPSPAPLNTGYIVVLVLVIILLLAITVLCFYKWNSRHSGQDGSAPRLLLGVRERMRGRVRSLEDWLGLSLWPGKRVVEGDEEEGEGGKSGDGEAAAGARGGQDEGDSSDDYSSLDGIDLSERAKNLEDDEKKEALKSGSEGGQYNMKGERTDGRKEGGEEERTGENSGEGDTCDLTAL